MKRFIKWLIKIGILELVKSEIDDYIIERTNKYFEYSMNIDMLLSSRLNLLLEGQHNSDVSNVSGYSNGIERVIGRVSTRVAKDTTTSAISEYIKSEKLIDELIDRINRKQLK
jgi:hypothetical protein